MIPALEGTQTEHLKMTSCGLAFNMSVCLEIRYNLLIHEIIKCFNVDFHTFKQSQASCFILLPV